MVFETAGPKACVYLGNFHANMTWGGVMRLIWHLEGWVVGMEAGRNRTGRRGDIECNIYGLLVISNRSGQLTVYSLRGLFWIAAGFCLLRMVHYPYGYAFQDT